MIGYPDRRPIFRPMKKGGEQTERKVCIRKYGCRWMPWLGSRRRPWQAAISPGEAHAALEPGIAELLP